MFGIPEPQGTWATARGIHHNAVPIALENQDLVQLRERP